MEPAIQGKLKKLNFTLNILISSLIEILLIYLPFLKSGEPEENGSTFEENAIIKSTFFFKKTNCLTLSDDSGFIVEEMENFPGIKTARVAKEMGSEQKVVEYIFSKKTKEKKISATFYCSLSLIGQGTSKVVTGNIAGYIIPYKKGNDGFGYDPFFIPLHSEKTFAEMGHKEKMKLSHRFEAFKILSTIQK